MARGDPFVQSAFPIGGQVVVPGTGRSGPNVPYGLGGNQYGGGSGGYGGGYGAADMLDLYRRRRLEEAGGVARYPGKPQPPIGQNPPTPNPYKGIEHFENYTGGPRILGDTLSWWNRHKVVPGQNGYPTRDRVQDISDAQNRLEGRPVIQRSFGGGTGAGIDDYADILKRLLRERGGL